MHRVYPWVNASRVTRNPLWALASGTLSHAQPSPHFSLDNNPPSPEACFTLDGGSR